jgi:hypothetical protein
VTLAVIVSATVIAQAQQSSRGGFQSVTLEDREFGIPEGKASCFAGWSCAGSVDRSDKLTGGAAAVELKMVSPDGSESVEYLSKPLHTGSPANPAVKQLDPRLELTMFHSTGDLLLQYAIPGLGLGGQPGAPMPAAAAAVARAEQNPGTFADGAKVRITGISGWKEAMVAGFTVGTNRGTRAENSMTQLTVLIAPAGKLDALEAAFQKLPPLQVDPRWQQLETARNKNIQQLNNKATQDYDARQQKMNDTNRKSNADATARRDAASAASNRQTAREQQAAQDSAALTIALRNGQHISFKWCDGHGGYKTVTDSVNSPGPGYERCP